MDGFEGIVINLWDLDAAGHQPFEGLAIAFGLLVGIQLLAFISCLAHDLFTFLAHSNFTLAELNGLGKTVATGGSGVGSRGQVYRAGKRTDGFKFELLRARNTPAKRFAAEPDTMRDDRKLPS